MNTKVSSTEQDRPDRPSTHDRAGVGRTQAGRDGEAEPRLPHERDLSSDSQTAANASARRVGQQAHADLAAGRQDTDPRQQTLGELNRRTMPPSDPDAGRDKPAQSPRPR